MLRGLILTIILSFVMGLVHGEGTDKAKREELLKKYGQQKPENPSPSASPTPNPNLDVEYIKEVQDMSSYEAMRKLIEDGKIAALLKHNQENMEYMSEEQLVTTFSQGLSGSPLGGFFKENPKYTLFIVKVFRDKEATQGIVDFLEDKKRLFNYGIFFIVSLILGFFITNYATHGKKFFPSLMTKFSLGIVYMGIRGGVFLYMFFPHLEPSYRIWKTMA